MKFRKKSIIIDAYQITEETRQNNFDWPDWLHRAWSKEIHEEGALYPSEYPNSDGTDKLKICTLEGALLVDWGDWIIRGVNNELYPCKPDIFEKTYDRIE